VEVAKVVGEEDRVSVLILEIGDISDKERMGVGGRRDISERFFANDSFLTLMIVGK
jgi:hypothetical protein